MILTIFTVHVECAHQAGYILGFDIAPVKGSRRDQFNIVNINGEVGTMTAAIWCKEHVPTKTIVHRMNDIVDESGLNALQLYVQNFKQADLTLTGTVRKATLVNQSTKVVSTTSTTQTPNRKGSTTTGANGQSGPSRGSISHAKAEETAHVPSITGVNAQKICATCGIDVSPKWWLFSPDTCNSRSINGDLQSKGEHSSSDRIQSTEDQFSVDILGESGGSHVALATAALHQNTPEEPKESTEFQCHQCHWNKVQKEPTPPPPVKQRETSRPPTNGIPTAYTAPAPDPPPHAWSAAPPYASNGPYSSWSHPSPASQGVTVVSHLNGNHSPSTSPSTVQPLNGQMHVRQSSHGQAHSPQQNGHINQLPNGYPPSPHRSLGSSALHLQNGTYGSYASTRLTPQHLTNGGPPPRAPEHPFSSAPMPSRSPFGPPQGSPPMHHDTHPQMRDTPQSANARQNEGRINGGASASPSLRNLLS